MHTSLLLLLTLITTPVLAQGSARVSVQCSVRIRPIAAADYNPASEFTLWGTVTEVQDGILKLRLPFGVVRIQVGTSFPSNLVTPGQTVAVVASKLQGEQGQRLVAREVRTGSTTLTLRDAQGAPTRS